METRYYNAEVIQVISGDTLEVDIDLGFGRVHSKQIIKIDNITAPPVNNKEGETSRKALENLLLSKEITILAKKKDNVYYTDVYMKFGQMNSFYVNLYMVESGYARYTGSLGSKGTNRWPGIKRRTTL